MITEPQCISEHERTQSIDSSAWSTTSHWTAIDDDDNAPTVYSGIIMGKQNSRQGHSISRNQRLNVCLKLCSWATTTAEAAIVMIIHRRNVIQRGEDCKTNRKCTIPSPWGCPRFHGKELRCSWFHLSPLWRQCNCELNLYTRTSCFSWW